MTIMQMDFLNELAKLFKAYNVAVVTRYDGGLEIHFKDPEEYPLRFMVYADEIFHEVQTTEDYKPTETELEVYRTESDT